MNLFSLLFVNFIFFFLDAFKKNDVSVASVIPARDLGIPLITHFPLEGQSKKIYDRAASAKAK